MSSSTDTVLPTLGARTARLLALSALLVAGIGCSDPASPSDSGTGDPDAGPSAPDSGPSAPDSGQAVADSGAPRWCSPLLQNCGDRNAKCSVVDIGSGVATLFCDNVSEPGTVAEGGSCTASQLGYDDCVPGLLCAGVGNDVPRCRAYCLGASDCGAQQDCFDLPVSTPDEVEYGVCAPTCTAFGACPADRACERLARRADGMGSFLVCRAGGTTPIGSSCSDDRDCVAGAMCATGTCRAVCDDAHPCASGTCAPLPGADGAIGTCS